MADELKKIIVVEADTDQANSNLEETKSLLEDIDAAQSSAATNTAASTKKSTDAIKKSTAAVKENRQGILENGGAVGILNELTGGLASTVKDAVEATSLFTKESYLGAAAQKVLAFATGGATVAANALRIALIATGIGAIVVAIGTLIVAYNQFGSSAAQAKISQDAFNASLEQTKKLFEQSTNAISFGTDYQLALAKKRGASEAELNKIREQGFKDQDERLQLEIKRQEEINGRINENDEESLKKGKERLVELQKAKDDNFDKSLLSSAEYEADQAQQERDAAKQKQDQAGKDAETKRNQRKSDLKAIADLEKKYREDAENLLAKDDQERLNLEKKRGEKSIEQMAGDEKDKAQLLLSFQADIAAKQFLLDEKSKKERIELEEKFQQDRMAILSKYDIQIKSYAEASSVADIAMIEQMNADKLSREQGQAILEAQQKGLSLEDQKKIEDYYREEKAKNEKDALIAEIDFKTSIKNQEIDLATGAIGILKQLGEKNKAIQKAAIVAENVAAIAKIIVNTAAANAKAVAASPLTGGQPFVAINTIGAGIGIASSVLATAKALSQLGGGGGAGGANASAGGAPPAPKFNVVGSSEQSQLTNTIAGQQNAPQRAYVVAGDVTSAQSMERNIITSATFG